MKDTEEITNSHDIIDSRDVIARIDHLESFLIDEDDYDKHEDYVEIGDERYELEQYEAVELEQLRELADEARGYAPDWKYGAALIRDSFFEDYARELAEDIGAIEKNASWPNDHIDWEDAADALKQDYTEIDFDGVAYWIR